ncbi:MAG: RidA family protein [Rhodospirillaceae bacterium]|jgi:enamine deaminase RidA (YjgF/YER057c/UK114 family)|nr:RidA family protein [Rhodospirillaceae bacterium]MBT5940129.1 RidA family protein [Rhodospirillaceae bacterium]MBT7265640.1 RidA family protein [Rhodospirillaceae bacterium]
MAGTIDARLAELGIELPEAAAPVANYVPYTVTGNLVFVSGQVPIAKGEIQYSGKLGEDVSIEDGQKAARLCGMNLIAQLKAACGGDLDRVTQVIKLGGFVNGTPDFTDQALVINGTSDLMVEVFQDKGKHARAAVGCIALPLGSAVEVDAVFEIA